MVGKLNADFWRATLCRGRTRQSASLQWEPSSTIPRFQHSIIPLQSLQLFPLAWRSDHPSYPSLRLTLSAYAFTSNPFFSKLFLRFVKAQGLLIARISRLAFKRIFNEFDRAFWITFAHKHCAIKGGLRGAARIFHGDTQAFLRAF